MRTASSISSVANIAADAWQPVTRAAPLRLTHAALATPVGELQLFASDHGLLSIALPNESRAEATRRLEHAHGPLAIMNGADHASEPHGRTMPPAPSAPDAADPPDRATAILALAYSELRAYFATRVTADTTALFRFTVPLDLRGTPFQRQAWLAVADIPCGATRTYGEIAQTIGRPAAVRAVGAANGANPLPIVIPCHRVIGADHTLTGYGGGLPMKRWLLEHEGVALNPAE